MKFGKCMGTFGVIGGRLYEVWEVYGDPMGVIGVCLYEVWEVYGDPRGVIGGHLYEVCEVYGDPGGHRGRCYVVWVIWVGSLIIWFNFLVIIGSVPKCPTKVGCR